MYFYVMVNIADRETYTFNGSTKVGKNALNILIERNAHLKLKLKLKHFLKRFCQCKLN